MNLLCGGLPVREVELVVVQRHAEEVRVRFRVDLMAVMTEQVRALNLVWILVAGVYPVDLLVCRNKRECSVFLVHTSFDLVRVCVTGIHPDLLV